MLSTWNKEQMNGKEQEKVESLLGLAPILGNVDHVTSVAIWHGLHYEAVARAQYHSQTKHEHKDQKIEEYGLIIDKEFPCLAASPDGVVTCTCHGKKLVEIKCSYKLHD